jgi:hypothetical protein
VLALLLMVGLAGCVGIRRSDLDWVGVASRRETKAEVVARLGPPRRTERTDGRETWYYRLSKPGPSGQYPATEAPNVLYLIVFPVPWVTRPDENVRFDFEGDTVASAGELRVTERGFLCGLNFMHPGVFICGSTH